MTTPVPKSLTGVVHGTVSLEGKPVPNVRVSLVPVVADTSFVDKNYNAAVWQQVDPVHTYTDANGAWRTSVLAPGEDASPSELQWAAVAYLNGCVSTAVRKAASREEETDFGVITLSRPSAGAGGSVDLGPLEARISALESKPAGEALTPQQKSDLASIFTLTNRVHALETSPKVDLGPVTQRIDTIVSRLEKVEKNPVALVLKSGDPVPAGTPAGSIIVRV